MKFGKSLSNQIEETLPEWRDKFLSYKELKKRLNTSNGWSMEVVIMIYISANDQDLNTKWVVVLHHYAVLSFYYSCVGHRICAIE